MDRVRALKIEHPSSGGTDVDEEPNSLNPSEDFLDARGVTLQDDTSDDEHVVLTRDPSGNMTFQDEHITSPKTLTELASGSGMTPGDHRVLDQLVHAPDESYYEEYVYSGFKVQRITLWTDSSKTTKIREYTYTYTGNKITQEVAVQYDGSGTEVERMTYDYTYSGWRITSVDVTRT